jgi:hypothetical protein
VILPKSMVAPSKSPPVGETLASRFFKSYPTGEDLGGAFGRCYVVSYSQRSLNLMILPPAPKGEIKGNGYNIDTLKFTL